MKEKIFDEFKINSIVILPKVMNKKSLNLLVYYVNEELFIYVDISMRLSSPSSTILIKIIKNQTNKKIKRIKVFPLDKRLKKVRNSEVCFLFLLKIFISQIQKINFRYSK